MPRQASSLDGVGALAVAESEDGAASDGQSDPGPDDGDREVSSQQGWDGGSRCVQGCQGAADRNQSGQGLQPGGALLERHDDTGQQRQERGDDRGSQVGVGQVDADAGACSMVCVSPCGRTDTDDCY